MLGSAECRPVAPIMAVPRTRDLPLSFAQQRLWFLDQLLPEKGVYNIPAAWRLNGPLDVRALQCSVEWLLARHESLRTRFVLSEGEPLQIIDAVQPVDLPVTDLSAMPEAMEIINREAAEPFDLQAGPLLRAHVLRLGDEEHVFLVNVHHIASDGWSMGILERELSMAYISQNEDTQQAERRTRFVSKHHNDVDEVMFSYFGHQRLYQDANEADTALVAYYSARDRDDSRKTNLMRRETRRLSNLKIDDQPGEADIVCDDVVRLKLDYWDLREKVWRDEWNTTTADGQPDRLPSKIRVTLTVRDERGKEVPLQTEARLVMLEPLSNQPKNLSPTGPGVPPSRRASASLALSPVRRVRYPSTSRKPPPRPDSAYTGTPAPESASTSR